MRLQKKLCYDKMKCEIRDSGINGNRVLIMKPENVEDNRRLFMYDPSLEEGHDGNDGDDVYRRYYALGLALTVFH